MLLAYLRQQRDEVEAAYLRAITRRELPLANLLSDKLVSLIDEIARLEEIKTNSKINYS